MHRISGGKVGTPIFSGPNCSPEGCAIVCHNLKSFITRSIHDPTHSSPFLFCCLSNVDREGNFSLWLCMMIHGSNLWSLLLAWLPCMAGQNGWMGGTKKSREGNNLVAGIFTGTMSFQLKQCRSLKLSAAGGSQFMHGSCQQTISPYAHEPRKNLCCYIFLRNWKYL